jgi:hypothetical protein
MTRTYRMLIASLVALLTLSPVMAQIGSLPGMAILQPFQTSGAGCAYVAGAAISDTDVLTIATCMSTRWSDTAAPSAGGTLTINSASLASYDYVKVTGNQTVSAFSAATWFTATQDSRSAWVIINGNLTINAGQVFTPSVRKLFTVIYVNGACTINGQIAMDQRGANHSASGSNITAAAIQVATGTHGGVSNPVVPAAGAAGGASVTNVNGNPGSAGTAGTSGGGGSGGDRNGAVSGAGAAGTSFSGGPGGGGSDGLAGNNASPGAASGGAGGSGTTGSSSSQGGSGGAGNPGGTGAGNGSTSGNAGTGGTLVLICTGAYSGSGSITSAGANGGGASSTSAGATGAGSGGGSVNIMYGSDAPGPVPTAAGGAGGVYSGGGSSSIGGAGGNGTARKFAI